MLRGRAPDADFTRVIANELLHRYLASNGDSELALSAEEGFQFPEPWHWRLLFRAPRGCLMCGTGNGRPTP
jgi:hypothetical protein